MIMDLDGVICQDPTVEQNDDGEKYIDFIKNSKPKFVPTNKIYAIVTNRLEKYRPETTEWLKKYGVKYQQLIMLDLQTKQDRLKINPAVVHKGVFYKKSEAVLFIESSYNQSIDIATTSGKPVYCVDKNVFIEPNMAKQILNQPKAVFFRKYYAFKHKIKMLLIGNSK